MISNLGTSLLYLTAIFYGLNFISIVTNQEQEYSRIKQGNHILPHFAFISSIASFLLLEYGFIISDFSIINVYQNSSTIKPLIYKIAAGWSSHEGSLLLWSMLSSLLGYIFFHQSHNSKSLLYAYALQSLIIALFYLYIVMTSNPFAPNPVLVSEGLGLNPLLQDVALAIHPPILYLGYVVSLVPFSIIMSVMIKGDEKDSWKLAQHYNILSWFCLTIGIALGSWWAYRELGWGGYWFFDPVENLSLLPWLSSTALLHSLGLSVKNDELKGWGIILAILNFILCIGGTFLVRSGLLVSVHSFANDLTRSSFILYFLCGVVFFALCIYWQNRKKYILGISKSLLFILKIFWHIALYILDVISYIYFSSARAHSPGSDEFVTHYHGSGIYNSSSAPIRTVIGIAIILLLSAITVVVMGVTYPILNDIFSWGPAIAIDMNYYALLFIPVMILLYLCCTIFSTKISYLRYGLLTAILSAIGMGFFETDKAIYFAIGLSGVIIFLITLFRHENKGRYLSMILAHLGFGVLILAITIEVSYRSETQLKGEVGAKTELNGFEFVIQKIDYSEKENYLRRSVSLSIKDIEKSDEIVTIYPESRLYKIENMVTSDASFYSSLFYDLYASVQYFENNYTELNIYYRPAMSWIWISIFIMAVAIIIKYSTRQE